jgi:hypothetical protein
MVGGRQHKTNKKERFLTLSEMFIIIKIWGLRIILQENDFYAVANPKL